MSAPLGAPGGSRPSALVLCPNLANNSLGRAMVLAELLEGHYDVRIAGHQFGPERWAPARDSHLAIERLAGRNWLGVLWHWRRNTRRLAADVLVASKPLPQVMVYAEWARRRGRTVVLDIDDDEIGLARRRGVFKRHLQGVLRFFSPRSYYHFLWAERLTRRFARITCASTLLQHRYGGTVIYHARRMGMLQGAPLQGSQEQDRARIAAAKSVLFLGTPRRHKGIDVLARAVARLADPDVLLAVVGCRSTHDVQQQLAAYLPAAQLLCVGQVPLESVAQWLQAATVVVIPQQREAVAEAQTPAKLFDAMCCGVALVTTRVGDIPLIVGDAALVIDDPEDDAALAQALARLLADPALLQLQRQALAQRFERDFSFAATAARMVACCSERVD
ncbi:MAG TPA: glycosyltransferase family 4 protein [Steroidobacteraceae bacterium]|nr:glycosyltransferase family 4 protein [Steroidobacteraceae bacterium]